MMKKLGALIVLIWSFLPLTAKGGGTGGGGSPPALEISLEQFSALATGALRGELLEVMNGDGDALYFEPTTLDFHLKTMEARSVNGGESTLVLKGLDGKTIPSSAALPKKLIPSELPSDLTINTVPRN